MNGNSKFRYYNKICALMKRQGMFIFSGKEIVQVIQLHPFPYTHTLWKASDLVFDVISHMSKKFRI